MVGVKWLERGQLVKLLKEIFGEDLIDDGNMEKNIPMKIVTVSSLEDDESDKKNKHHFVVFYCPDGDHPYAHLYIEKPGFKRIGNNQTEEISKAFCRVFEEDPAYRKTHFMSTKEREELNFSGLRCHYVGWGNTSSIRFS